jgi:hypothetical protein
MLLVAPPRAACQNRRPSLVAVGFMKRAVIAPGRVACGRSAGRRSTVAAVAVVTVSAWRAVRHQGSWSFEQGSAGLMSSRRRRHRSIQVVLWPMPATPSPFSNILFQSRQIPDRSI